MKENNDALGNILIPESYEIGKRNSLMSESKNIKKAKINQPCKFEVEIDIRKDANKSILK